MFESLTLQGQTLCKAQSIEAELRAIQAESIGWQPLGDGAYLHVGDTEQQVIEVVGVAFASMAGTTVLWLV